MCVRERDYDVGLSVYTQHTPTDGESERKRETERYKKREEEREEERKRKSGKERARESVRERASVCARESKQTRENGTSDGVRKK